MIINSIQKRHKLAVVKATSDRKMSAEEYISKRPQYLKIERQFRRDIGVILPRPVNYNEFHEEIWQDGEMEKWDARRELNIDEVPFQLDMSKTKQIVGPDERKSVVTKGNKYIAKYRTGSLVFVSNFEEILLTVIIFSQGGSGVAKLLEKLEGSVTGTPVVWYCSESGSMTGYIWYKTMNHLKMITNQMRGCKRMDGLDWQKGIVLNIDNYSVHLDSELATKLAVRYGIFSRCLIKNASHIQQPIDQHIGVHIKNRLKRKMQQWFVDNERMESIGQELIFTKQKWREVVARYVQNVIDEVNANKKKHVLVLAWQNFGLFLPMDGSKDGDITTLHLDANKAPTPERQRRTKGYVNKVTIQKRADGIGARIYPYINSNLYSMEKAEKSSRIPSTVVSQILPQLKDDLSQSNQQLMNRFKKQFKKDLTNDKNVLPDLDNIITPFDVLTLQKMYMKYKGKKKNQRIIVKQITNTTQK